jgi:hypothetical protein
MDAAQSSETSVHIYRTTYHIPEKSSLHIRCHGNRILYMMNFVVWLGRGVGYSGPVGTNNFMIQLLDILTYIFPLEGQHVDC